jgi:hypothetical protein
VRPRTEQASKQPIASEEASAPALAPAPGPPSSSGWPGNVPPLEQALRVVTDRAPPPTELEAGTRQFLSSLAFAERAALHDLSPSGGSQSLCWIVAIRWRLMAALATRPQSGEVTDPAALDQLLAEIDGTLASLSQLRDSDDPDLQQACDAARVSIARDVHKLIPTSSGRGVIEGADDVQQLRKALAVAANAKAAKEPRPSRLRAITQGRNGKVALALALVFMASGLVTAVRGLWSDRPVPVPSLPAPPPNSEFLGDPESGTVILHSTNGKPLDREALDRYSVEAAKSGAAVQPLGPTQALITASGSAR